MIVLGVILILLAAGGIALVSLEPTATDSTATFTDFGYVLHPTHLDMFVTGAATAAVLLIGLAMISSGSRRAARRRRALRSTRHEARDRVSQLEDEKRMLQQRLDTDDQLEDRHTSDRLVAGAPAQRPPEEDHR
ncbi:hypothetical protein ACIBG8_28400 [Nonomuraea sp. NPDC050556]|uniref:hypothetical protein n=1 Tax=Nonomuraea sp. NPDC050556 TaxID=3364369 RepID=UPI003789002D